MKEAWLIIETSKKVRILCIKCWKEFITTIASSYYKLPDETYKKMLMCNKCLYDAYCRNGNTKKIKYKKINPEFFGEIRKKISDVNSDLT